MEKKNPCIVMVPSPGLSHLIPLIEFAKQLIHQHQNFHVKFLIPTLGPPSPSTKSILNTLPPNISFTILPQVNVEDLPLKSLTSTQIRLTVKHSLPFLHEAVASLSSKNHLVALVFSIFSTDALDVAKEFNLLSYVFFASGATFLSFCLYLPQIDESVVSSHESLLEYFTTKTVNFPGCVVPFQVKDLPDPILYERSSEVYKSFLSVCQRHSLVDGAIVNTFTDLEADAIRAIQLQREEANEDNNNSNSNGPFMYPIGPIIQAESANKAYMLQCVTWLDSQEPDSVVYVSFGSGGTLTHEQLNEIAFGLELSGHKFLWVLRGPSNFASSPYLVGKQQEEGDPLNYLPSGFLDRIKGKGLVVPNWAPQVEVLGHGSTGGFLSHCGWNSILESVVYGVPLIAWPLFAEQRMNAIFVTDVLKVAVWPKCVDDDEKCDGIVTRNEIANVIKVIMGGGDEGLGIRKRMKELSDAAAFAMSENGSSKKALSSLAHTWQSI